MIVNTHLHIVRENPEIDSLVSSEVFSKAWLLSVPFFPELGGDEQVIKAAKKYPDFYIPFGFLDFRKNPEHIDQLYARGFVGLKAIWPPKAYDDESLLSFYEKAQDYKMPIVFHTSAGATTYFPEEKLSGIELRFIRGKFMQVGTLDYIAKIFPKLPIIGAHMGGGLRYDLAIHIAQRHPNLYYDISGSTIVRNIGAVQNALAQPWMHDRLLFGTDGQTHRIKNLERLLHFWERFLDCNTTKEIKEKIIGLNAERIIASLGR